MESDDWDTTRRRHPQVGTNNDGVLGFDQQICDQWLAQSSPPNQFHPEEGLDLRCHWRAMLEIGDH